ncbi:hypothetical protein JQN58_00820 [Aneurinibacillus sp. BA2021]|nr:hypothetical protein [Aneurinibacillus sp. BA2021]
MKYSLPLALLLLASPMVSGIGEAANEPSISPAAEQRAETKISPIPPVVQQTLDKLIAIQPILSRMHVDMSFASETDQRFIIHLSSVKPGETSDMQQASSAYLTFDRSTGILLAFNMSVREWASDKLPSRPAAIEAAETFLLQWFGEAGRKQFGTPVSNGSGASTIYQENGTAMTWKERHVEFPMLLNGLPVTHGQSLRVSVDELGRIVSYTYKPIDTKNVSIPSPEQALSVDEIKQKLADSGQVYLSYAAEQPDAYGPRSLNTNTKPALKYDLSIYPYLHPVTAHPIDMMSGQETKNEFSAAEKRQFTLQPKAQPLLARSEAEAKQKALALFGATNLAAQLREDKAFMPEQEKNNPSIMYHFSTEQHTASLTISIDKKTQRIEQANLQLHQEQAAPAAKVVAKEQALQTALAFLTSYAGKTASQVEWTDYTWSEPEPPSWVDKSKLPERVGSSETGEYSFFFMEMHQGIPVQDRSYHVGVDKQTGNVTSFSLAEPKTKLDLPDAASLVTKEEALHTLLANKSLQLQYVWPQYFEQQAPAPILVYGPAIPVESSGYVDAKTGAYVAVPIQWDEE